jgi:hypothetical protein
LLTSSLNVRAAALETVPFVPTPLPKTVVPNPMPAGMLEGMKLPAGMSIAQNTGPCKPSLKGLQIPKRSDGSSQDPQASRQIQSLIDRDQNARKNGTFNETDDLKNRTAVLPLIARASTAQDFSNIALIFQHGNCIAHFQLTTVLATRGGNLWLSAASIDRALMNLGKAQKYGTEYLPVAMRSECYALYMVDPRTTDAERVAMKVPVLEKAKTLSDKSCK